LNYFDGRTGEGLYLIPTHLAFDAVTGYHIQTPEVRHLYTATTVARLHDSVHFTATAGYQLGALFTATLLRHTA
jgi:hypothetical protein